MKDVSLGLILKDNDGNQDYHFVDSNLVVEIFSKMRG